MPSITSYSPYETLAFFQSIAQHGFDASELSNVSTSLKQNELIRNNPGFDINRFSINALEGLYHKYVPVEKDEQNPVTDGDLVVAGRSPKRRKLSNTANSQNSSSLEQQQGVQDLVAQLYLRYKVEVICEIKKDEEAFVALQAEIKALENEIESETKRQTLVPSDQSAAAVPHDKKADTEVPNGVKATVHSQPSRSSSTLQDSQVSEISQEPTNENLPTNTHSLRREETKSPHTAETIPVRAVATAQQSRLSQTPIPAPAQNLPQGAYPRQIPSPVPQRPNHGHIPAQSTYQPGQASPGHALPSAVSAQQRPQIGSQQVSTQGRASPMQYQNQHAYSPYQHYPPQWHPHMPPQQYQQHPQYGPPPTYYPPPPNGRHPQTPQQVQYPPYAHATPVHYMQQPQQQQWRGQPWPLHTTSATTTPLSRPDSRLSMPGSESSTPWKSKQQTSQRRHRSPPPTDREVSPITDNEDSPVRVKTPARQGIKIDIPKKLDEEPLVQPPPRRRGRPPSMTPSAIAASRSQSIASRASDAQTEKQHAPRRGHKIKAEPPSTPLPIPYADTEQRSSGRRGRPRSSTLTSQADGVRATTTKRKRDSASPSSPVRSPPVPSLVALQPRRPDQSHDPNLVIVSKSFARTSQLLLSEITSHKLAGIFAKPLSERDAPGYKDLVLRPQDLKSIKAAVSKGGRAAFAVIEAIEGDNEATPTKAQPASISDTGVGSVGNGFYVVPQTPELLPPKGIVNSAQLEMELMRMFANAIMFNPLPTSERGFGRSLRLRKNGGDVDTNADLELSASEGSESSSIAGTDEGGIISDAREMFSDVVEVVAKWRELEGERIGSAADTTASRSGSLAVPVLPNSDNGRYASVSASSNIGEDETAAADSETASTPAANIMVAPLRKRRRVAEH